MNPTEEEIEARIQKALDAIRETLETNEDEVGAALFISHHIAELPSSYWEEHLKTSSPESGQIIDMLIRSPGWEPAEDGLDLVDLTLPDEVTQYLISVSFNEAGDVEDITMES